MKVSFTLPQPNSQGFCEFRDVTRTGLGFWNIICNQVLSAVIVYGFAFELDQDPPVLLVLLYGLCLYYPQYCLYQLIGARCFVCAYYMLLYCLFFC